MYTVNALPIVKLEALYKDGVKRIALRFGYDKELIALSKEAGALWSHSERCWHVEDGSASLKRVYAVFKGFARLDGSALFGQSAPERKPQQAAPAKPPGQGECTGGHCAPGEQQLPEPGGERCAVLL